MITLITPTGDRHEAFSLCEFWMSRQTYRGNLQWIVVDDGKTPTRCTAGQEYVRREPKRNDPSHTLALNLQTVLPRVKGDSILFIEDDDYYAPTYIETMAEWLEHGDIAGERGARYYFLRDKAYYFWTDHNHASLCRTGVNRPAFDALRRIVNRARGDWRIDLNLWESFCGKRNLVDANKAGRAQCVGIKQMPGRAGITHRLPKQANADPDGVLFREWLGDDARHYHQHMPIENLATYSCLFGGYDKIHPAPDDNSYMVTNDPEPAERKGWKTIVPEKTFETPKQASRYWKMHSHELFPGRPTLYIDANVRLKVPPQKLADHMHGASVVAFRHNKSKTIREEVLNAQNCHWVDRRFLENRTVRENYDLPVAWGGCLLRMPDSAEFNETWWELFQGLSRDQIVMPIALDRSGASYRLLEEPIPFFGQTSRWLDVTKRHLKKRSVS